MSFHSSTPWGESPSLKMGRTYQYSTQKTPGYLHDWQNWVHTSQHLNNARLPGHSHGNHRPTGNTGGIYKNIPLKFVACVVNHYRFKVSIDSRFQPEPFLDWWWLRNLKPIIISGQDFVKVMQKRFYVELEFFVCYKIIHADVMTEKPTRHLQV